MSLDWYRQRLARPTSRMADTPRAVPRFAPGPDGKAVRVDEGAPEPPPWQQRGPGIDAAPLGQIHVGDAVRYWKGSRDAQSQGGCPRCGSGNYFSEMRAGSMDGQAGESGKLSLGHCFDCGARPGGRGQPTPQPRTSLRGARQEDVPVHTARSPQAAEFGGFQVIARVG